MSFRALPGGAAVTGTTTPQVVDLTLFIGKVVSISCPTQDVLFCASSSPTDTAIVVGTQAPSATAKVADRAPTGVGKIRAVDREFPYFIVRTAAGTDVITIKPVARTIEEV